MSEGGVKLYANKPKKAQLKQNKEQQKAAPSPAAKPATSSAAAAAAASYKMGPHSTESAAPPPPPQPPKESFARRYKFLWPLLLTVNLVVGAYLFTRTSKKDTDLEEGTASNVSSTPNTSTLTAMVAAEPVSVPAIAEAVKLPKSLPEENQQRELFKWILEEKRKIKPKDAEERKRIDDEKALLKQFIRAKSVPTI